MRQNDIYRLIFQLSPCSYHTFFICYYFSSKFLQQY